MNADKKMAKLLAKIFNAKYIHDDQAVKFILGVIDNYMLDVFEYRGCEVVIVLEGYCVIIRRLGAKVLEGEYSISEDDKVIKLKKKQLIKFRN